MSVVMRGNGFELRPWTAADLNDLVRHANHVEVAYHTSHRFPHPYTKADGERFLRQRLSRKSKTGECAFAIVQDGEALGGIAAHAGEGVDRHAAELGYWLGRTAWGKGLATAVVGTFWPHAMRELRLYRLFARVHATHARSIRVLEKNGFEYEGCLRLAAFKHEQLHDVLMYARVREVLEVSEPGSG